MGTVQKINTKLQDMDPMKGALSRARRSTDASRLEAFQEAFCAMHFRTLPFRV